ncbi:MAG: zinc ribbon domain-containing protein [Defluviitaleaceae bacterium]|nr:zinc ribbon domain-containing protein [Defluviitaleaceae bacterium]
MEAMVFCQSCGAPMNMEGMEFGKNADGSMSNDYCSFCYVDGAFASPDETLEQMIESCVPHVVEAGGEWGTEDAARKMLEEHLPTLKRWRS